MNTRDGIIIAISSFIFMCVIAFLPFKIALIVGMLLMAFAAPAVIMFLMRPKNEL